MAKQPACLHCLLIELNPSACVPPNPSSRERKALQGRADELAAQMEHAAQRHAAELTALRQEQEAAQQAAAADLGRQQRVRVSSWPG